MVYRQQFDRSNGEVLKFDDLQPSDLHTFNRGVSCRSVWLQVKILGRKTQTNLMDANALICADHQSAVSEVWWAIGGQTQKKKKKYDTWRQMSQIHGIPLCIMDIYYLSSIYYYSC